MNTSSSALALILEPHLPLIKSHTLNSYYLALRYQREPAEPYLIALQEEARLDYRLARLLQRIKPFHSPAQHHPMK